MMASRPDFASTPAWRRALAGKRVLLTGHTGFKGSWACLMLRALGARVTGLSLAPQTEPSLYALAGVGSEPGISSFIGDIRDRETLANVVAACDPELVLHMAAQPLVRRSYREPVETFATNVMGTVNLLDALRTGPSLKAVLVVTTDKVYENDESGRAFIESDALGGHDPYAASKAAAEIVVSAYRRSFLAERGVRVASARGGNVIGGGDFSEDRLVPDIVRAAAAGRAVEIRNPAATRPWQHVLDCLSGYLAHLAALSEGADVPLALNFGPDADVAPMSVGAVTDCLNAALGRAGEARMAENDGPHEMATLSIDPALARQVLGWRDILPGEAAIQATAGWYGAWLSGKDMGRETRREIAAYLSERELSS